MPQTRTPMAAAPAVGVTVHQRRSVSARTRTTTPPPSTLLCLIVLIACYCERSSAFDARSIAVRRFARSSCELSQRSHCHHYFSTSHSNHPYGRTTTCQVASATTGADFGSSSSNDGQGSVNEMNEDTVAGDTAAVDAVKESEPTLYQILHAQPTDTRAELKLKYVQLAKVSHPDALINDDNSNNNNNNNQEADFTQIAAAWSILSDPVQRKRYDRQLSAQQFSDDVSTFVAKNAAPVTETTVKAIETLAFPFLRRSAATTLASVQSMSKDFSLSSAVAAAARAGKAVDLMELEEKSTALEQRAVAEYKEAVRLQEAVRAAAAARLTLSLRTPQAGLTAAEAAVILKDLNATLLEPTFFERANFMRREVKKEIQLLQEQESVFVQHQKEDSVAQETYRNAVQERVRADTALEQALAVQANAKAAYDNAVKMTQIRQDAVDGIVENLYRCEVTAEKSSLELERLGVAVDKQSETVRTALRRKEKALHKQAITWRKTRGGGADNHNYDDPVTDEHVVYHRHEPETHEEMEARLAELQQLRAEERELAATAHHMEVQAAKLLSRSNKLKARARLLKR